MSCGTEWYLLLLKLWLLLFIIGNEEGVVTEAELTPNTDLLGPENKPYTQTHLYRFSSWFHIQIKHVQFPK